MSDTLKAILEIAFVLLTVVSSVLLLTGMLIWRSKQREDSRQVKAELSYAREYIERRLDEINHTYANNYNLWAEANRLPVEAQASDNNQDAVGEDFLSRIGIDISKIKIKDNQVLILMPIDKKYISVFRALQFLPDYHNQPIRFLSSRHKKRAYTICQKN